MIDNLGSRVVNAFLLPCEDGYVLIDTGYAGGFRRFRKKLAKRGIEPGLIRYVFLTHAHDDHAGFLNEVLDATGANVILHPGAVAGLQRGQNSFEGGCSFFSAWLFCKVLALFGHGDHRFPAIREEYLDRLIPVGSDRFRELSFPFSVLETPGHTADHISLAAGNALFCGDAAMNGFPSRKRITIWIENTEEYRRSWEKILETNPAVIYPAHGKAFRTDDLKKYLKSLDRVKLRPL